MSCKSLDISLYWGKAAMTVMRNIGNHNHCIIYTNISLHKVYSEIVERTLEVHRQWTYRGPIMMVAAVT
jgi:hypothetical protein